MKTLLLSLLFLTALPLLGDYDPSSPPSSYDTSGGALSSQGTAALAEAAHWIGLMDQSQYSSTWLDAGPMLRDLISQDEWMAAMQKVRRPLGTVRARKTSKVEFVQSLPAGTKGSFAVVTFQTTFSAKASAIEQIILMMIQYDQWRAISYTIK